MRVQGVADLIYNGLCGLGWRRYLCAMWLVCGELRSVYDDRWTDAERSLMASTLEVVRGAVMTGRVTEALSSRAEDLSRQWRVKTVAYQDEVLPGQWNTWVVFRDLAAEIAGTSKRYEAAERVDLAATDRWRETRQGPVLQDDPDEEIDDVSPMGRVLTVLDRSVTGVAGMPESDLREAGWDPANVRTRLFA